MRSVMRVIAIIVCVTICAASLQACGGGSDKPSVDTAKGANPNASPSALKATATASGPATAVAVTSFRYTVTVKEKRDGSVVRDYTTNGAYLAPDSHRFKSEGTNDGRQYSNDFVVIGNRAWERTETGQWATGDRSVVQNVPVLTSANKEFLAAYPGFLAKLVVKSGKKDTIDGAAMTRYDLDGDSDKKELARIFGTGENGDPWIGEAGALTIWIDNASGQLRRAILKESGVAPDASGQDVDFSMQVDATDVNAKDIAIAPPV